MASYGQMVDGTLTLEDVAMMHLAMDEVERQMKQAS